MLNGVAGTVPFAGPALMSSVWFPPDQRATATAIASFFNYFGVAMAFIVGKIKWCFMMLYDDNVYSYGLMSKIC